MNNKEQILNQYTLLDTFYKKLFENSMIETMCRAFNWLAIFLTMVFSMISYQSMLEEFDFSLFVFPLLICTGIAYNKLTPYLFYDKIDSVFSIMKKLKYVPVSRREFRKYLLRKLTLFLVKILIPWTIFQCIFGAISETGLIWQNIAYAITVAFIIPLLFGTLYIYTVK